MEIVEVKIVVDVVDGVTVDPTTTDAHDIVPVPVIVAAVLLPAALLSVTAPVTLKVCPVIVKVAAVPEKVNDAMLVDSAVLRVGWLVTVAGITTISDALVPGVLVPLDLVQFAVLSQAVLVVPFQVYVIWA